MAITTYGAARLYPTPLYSLTSTINKTGDGTPISVTSDIVLTGTLLPSKGNPSNDGAFPALDAGPGADGIAADTTAETTSDLKFKSLVKKQQGLIKLFNEDGQKFEIYNDDGSVKYTGYPEIVSVSFAQSVIVDRLDYTITIRGMELIGTVLSTYPGAIASAIKANLESLTESFSVDEQIDYDEDGAEVKIYSVSHSASGKARQSYNTTDDTLPGPGTGTGEGDDYDPKIRAFENVRTVLQSIVTEGGLSETTLSTFLSNTAHAINVADYRITDDFTAESGDYYDGSYTITRSMVLRESGSGDTYVVSHEYTVDVQMNSPNLASNKGSAAKLGYVNNYTINGTIQGYRAIFSEEDEDVQKSAYVSADLAYKAIINANNYKPVIDLINGVISNNSNLSTTASIPSSSSVSRNKRKGTITYSFSFTEKPAADNPVAAKYFLDYDVVASEKHDDNKIAVIPILGRAHGPIIQKLNTTGLYTRSISGTFVLKNSGTAATGYGNPYDWDEIGTIRVQAVNVIEAEPAGLLAGSQGTDWHLTDWNDSLDVFKGVYSINLTLSVVRDSDVAAIAATGGWMEF